MRACIEANVSKASLAQRSIDERLAIYRDLRDQHGKLIPERLVESAEDHVQIIARTANGELLDLTVLCEAESPHRMLGLRIMDAGPGEGDHAPAAASTPLSDDAAVKAWSTHLDSLTRAGSFSGAVMLMKNDVVLFRSAYGEASRETHTPNRADTKFNLGSINKMFTKVAIGQLAAQGKIQLDQTIDRYLPDYPKAVASKVTGASFSIIRAASETSSAYLRQPTVEAPPRVSDWIPLFRDKPLAFEPGISRSTRTAATCSARSSRRHQVRTTTTTSSAMSTRLPA
jgi:hypothetical protein